MYSTGMPGGRKATEPGTKEGGRGPPGRRTVLGTREAMGSGYGMQVMKVLQGKARAMGSQAGRSQSRQQEWGIEPCWAGYGNFRIQQFWD